MKKTKIISRIFLSLFAVLVVAALLETSNAVVVHDEPEINAYVVSKLVPAGQTYPLQIGIINTAKYDFVEAGTLEEEIAKNATLNAYNLTIWLEGNEKIQVKSGRIRLSILTPTLTAPLIESFMVTVPSSTDAGKYPLNLHVSYERIRAVEVYGNISGSYDIKYFYDMEEVVIPVEIEVTEDFVPVLNVFPLRTTYYDKEVTQLIIQVVNEGTGTARNIEVHLDGINVLDPVTSYISTLPPASSVPLTYTIKDEVGSYQVKAIINLSYYNGEKWVDSEQYDVFDISIESMSKGLLISSGDNEFERDKEGEISLYIMNTFTDPINSFSLKLKEPDGIDIKTEDIFVGYLGSGEVRSFKIPIEIDEKADFGTKNVDISGTFKILSSYPSEESINLTIPVYIKPEPDFEAKTLDTISIGENILKIEIINTGGDAKDVHVVLRPSPGILVKMPDSYAENLQTNGKATMSFKVDVDEDVIPGNQYRLEMLIKSEDYKGDERVDNVYAYVTVEEKPSYGYLLTSLLALIIIAVIIVKTKIKTKKKM